MTLSAPFVTYPSIPFNNINDDGQILLNCDFVGKLLGLYVTNKVNNQIIVSTYIITDTIYDVVLEKINEKKINEILTDSVSYEIFNDTLSENQSLEILGGNSKILNPGNILFIKTNFKTHLISCIMDYARFNELDS